MIIQFIRNRKDQILLILLLESLHAALWSGLDNPLSQSLLLVHFGLFIAWQPLQKSDQNITWYNATAFIFLVLAFTFWINWWLTIGWLILLIGITGGRVLTNRLERYSSFLVMIILFLELFIICIPSLLESPQTAGLLPPMQIFMAFLPAALLMFPPPKKSSTELSIDPLHAISTSLLTALLAMGSMVIVYQFQLNYFTALIQSFLVVGTGLIIISWLLSTNSSSGLSQVWTRSLLNIGTPFEQWLQDLARLKNKHDSSDDFLDAAVVKLVSLSWVSGVKWNQSGEELMHGDETDHKIETSISEHPLTLYTEVKISGALFLHCNLLIQLIQYLYEAKVNEKQLSRQAHLQAIYETGARITHDIKNLLQSMHSMVAILQADNLDGDSRSITILKKQFPYFIQRLEQAVYKLQAPENLDETNEIYISDWWRDINNQYKGRNILFEDNIESNRLVPFDLFNNVTENLIENAISKRQEEPEIEISVQLHSANEHLELFVKDTGSPIDKALAKRLFNEPVESYDGFGIGLYQARQLANLAGYTLNLADNEKGNVSFRLAKDFASG